MRRVVMTLARDISEDGNELTHYEPGDVEVFSEKIVGVLVRENACTVIGRVPDSFRSGSQAEKRALFDDKAASPPENKSAAPASKTTKKKAQRRRR